MLMELWHYSGPSATALWNLRDARAGESTETTAHDSDEGETDESEAEHPLGGHLSPYLRPSSTVFSLSEGVADALDEVEFGPEAPNVLGAGLAELDNPLGIDMLRSTAQTTKSC